jgi:hypothetical protein
MLRYVKDNKVLMVEDEFGNKEILDKNLKKSFDETEKIATDDEKDDENNTNDEGA